MEGAWGLGGERQERFLGTPLAKEIFLEGEGKGTLAKSVSYGVVPE